MNEAFKRTKIRKNTGIKKKKERMMKYIPKKKRETERLYGRTRLQVYPGTLLRLPRSPPFYVDVSPGVKIKDVKRATFARCLLV